jgi:hypothetical protein
MVALHPVPLPHGENPCLWGKPGTIFRPGETLRAGRGVIEPRAKNNS